MITEANTGPSRVGNSKDVLVNDIKNVVGDADTLVKDVVSSAGHSFSTARLKIETKLGEARSLIDGARTAVAESASSAAAATDNYIHKNPWQVLGAVVVAALAIGFLARRR